MVVGHSAVRLIRAARRKRFLDQLGAEWAELKAAGVIREDYGSTDQAQTLLSDTMESLEDANFDQEQLDLLRKLFISAAAEELTDSESPLPREYMEIGRGLAGGEIELLAQTYRYVPEWRNFERDKRPTGSDTWVRLMQGRTGLKHVSLIETHEQKLIDKRLLRKRLHGDRSGMETTDGYRLTDLGLAFCGFLYSYDGAVAAASERK